MEADNCIACKEDEILVKGENGKGTCRPKCDDGQFYDAENQECVDCLDGCNTCNNTSECLECTDGLFYLTGVEENQCTEKCPNGYFVDDNGRCQECSEGCDNCSSADECDTCSPFTALEDGKCTCQFNYEITARPTFHYIRVDLYNLVWEVNTTNITSGKRFNCSEIFDFEYDANEVDFEVDDIRCYGKDVSNDDEVVQRITIRSNDRDKLELLVDQDVKLSLNATVFSMDCAGDNEDLDLALEFPVSAPSCHTCGSLHDEF